MWDFLSRLLSADYMPHGHCYFWQPGVVWLHVLSDASISLAYYSIPLALVVFVVRRRDVTFRWMFVLFGVFILACGTTHVMSIITLWHPVYRLEGVLKLLTAVASIGTAILLWPLVPRALKLPSPEALATANRELAESNELLRRTEAAKSEFFANVSHELRTPLTLILAPVESLLSTEREHTAGERAHLLRTVHSNTVRMLSMVNELLETARVDAGRVEVARAGVDPTHLVSRIVEDFRPTAQLRGLTMELTHQHMPPVVSLDPYLYERIVLNLLSNALRHTPAGGTVSLDLSYEGDQLVLSVTDTGPGIPEEHREAVFERFQRLSGREGAAPEGTGLGLALVRDFAELLDGAVELGEGPEGGARFRVRVVAEEGGHLRVLTTSAPERAPAELGPPPESEGEPIAVSTENENRILVVEDHEELSQYMAGLLHGMAEVRVVADAEAALAEIPDFRPDLIVSDVMLPGDSGFDLCRAVKGESQTRDCTVILVTALTQREALAEGWEVGADDYLFKPFHPRELTTRVQTHLNLLASRRERHELRVRSQALELSNEALKEYAAVVSHDLQEPLRKLHLFGDRLRSTAGDDLSEKARGYLDRMLRTVPHMQHLIDDLLAYARVTTAGRAFERVPLDSALDQAVSNLEAAIEQSGATLTRDPLPEAPVDVTQMAQLFQNLIGNALKFHKPGEPPRIHVGPSESEPDFIAVVVSDEGMGFASAQEEEIFRIFHRLHPAGEYPGTGVGLAICRRIVDRHGGTIRARGRPGQGAEFRVMIPTR